MGLGGLLLVGVLRGGLLLVGVVLALALVGLVVALLLRTRGLRPGLCGFGLRGLGLFRLRLIGIGWLGLLG